MSQRRHYRDQHTPYGRLLHHLKQWDRNRRKQLNRQAHPATPYVTKRHR